MMPKKEFDIAHITLMLLKMRDNCATRREGEVYDDPLRKEKCEALNDAITLINNPSLLEKTTQRPLTLEELGTLGFAEVWEERRKPHRIEKTVAAYTYIAACHAKQNKEMAEVFGYNTEVRSWISIPTEGEMEAAKWET